jgi:hypothetical protein
MREENNNNHGLTPREQLDLYRVQLREAKNEDESKDLKEKVEDIEFHILKYGNYWE